MGTPIQVESPRGRHTEESDSSSSSSSDSFDDSNQQVETRSSLERRPSNTNVTFLSLVDTSTEGYSSDGIPHHYFLVTKTFVRTRNRQYGSKKREPSHQQQ